MEKSQVSLEVCFVSTLSKIFLEEGQSQLLSRDFVSKSWHSLGRETELVASTETQESNQGGD